MLLIGIGEIRAVIFHVPNSVTVGVRVVVLNGHLYHVGALGAVVVGYRQTDVIVALGKYRFRLHPDGRAAVVPFPGVVDDDTIRIG